MPNEAPIWISEQEVVSLLDLSEAIEALERGLLAEARGAAKNMVKTHVGWPAGTLHAIGAAFPEEGFAGAKTWAHTPGGATPLMVLFDANSGALKAIIEAFALGQMRTAAASGVATRCLAAEGADDFAIVGTGKQALAQVAAVMAVRPIRRVRVCGRNLDRMEQFARRVQDEFGVAPHAFTQVAAAVRGASVITVVTRATEPILTGDMLARGAHINAVGAITPERAEIAGSVLARSSRVVADSIPAAQKLSRELMDYYNSGHGRWEDVQPLAGLVASGERRSASDDLTLFKSLGTGIADLSLGIELYHRAVRQGVGRAFDHPQKAAPRLRPVAQIKT